MIIWSGWGAAIALAGIVVAGIITALATAISATPAMTAVGVLIGGIVGGVTIWLIVRRIESGPVRTLVDQANGQTVVIKKSAGSLFLIPARYWAFIVPAICVVAAIGAFMPGSTPAG